MNTKVNKLIKLAAAGLFLIALAINVKVTLDDPFVMVSEDAIAQTTSSSSCAGDTCTTYKYVGGQQQVFCTVCCSVGKNARCTVFECSCL